MIVPLTFWMRDLLDICDDAQGVAEHARVGRLVGRVGQCWIGFHVLSQKHFRRAFFSCPMARSMRLRSA